MAWRSKNFTCNGASQSLADLDANSNCIHRPICQLIIENPTGNDPLRVGLSGVDGSTYGMTVTAGPTAAKSIGPFSGSCPFNLEDVFVFGTNLNVIHIVYITL